MSTYLGQWLTHRVTCSTCVVTEGTTSVYCWRGLKLFSETLRDCGRSAETVLAEPAPLQKS